MPLRLSEPNIGVNPPVQAVDCPNCSMAYVIRDDKGKTTRPPEDCTRCGCPMDETIEGKKAQAWMDKMAADDHSATLAALGARYRGEKAKETADVD